jgi:LPS-assembly protein
MRQLRALIAALVVSATALIGAIPAVAQSRTQLGETPLLITADRMTHDRDLGVITASGNVEISQLDRILMADAVTYNERQDIVTASGNVSLVEPTGEVLFAEYMELTGDMRDGIIRQLRVRLADNARIAAAGGRRSDGNRTDMANAVYSPCDSCATDPSAPPLWQVKAKRVTHDQAEKTIEYRDAWMEVAGVPVAYTPYFSHPDPTVRRQSGFLTPSAGSSTFLGPFLSTPYFWNMAPNRDLTVTPTATWNQNAVLGVEYREQGVKTLTNARGTGTVDAEGDFRGNIDTSIKYHANETWRMGAQLQRASDDTFLRRYGIKSNGLTNRFLTSNLAAEAFRGRDYLGANAYAFQGLQAKDDPGQTPLVMPLVEYSHVGIPNNLGVHSSLTASTLVINRTDGSDSRRMSIEGGYHLPFVADHGSVFNIDATLRGDAYHVTSLPNPTIPGDEETGANGRLYPQLGLGWKYPLVRPHGRVNEILEPTVQFYTSPRGGNPWDIPNEDSLDPEFDDLNLFSRSRFPGIDRVEGGTRVSYGAKWGVYGPTGGFTDVFFGQSYRFFDDDTFASGTGLEDQLSDYVGRVRVSPGEEILLGYRTRLDKDSFAPRRNELNLTVGPRALMFNANYIFFDNQTSQQYGAREELSGGVVARLSRYWRGGFTARHDIQESDLRSLSAGLIYEDECFIFDTIVQRSYYQDRDLEPSDSIVFRLSFKTLGDIYSSASLSGL